MNASDRLADLYVIRQLILQRLIGGEQRAFNKLVDEISAELEKMLVSAKPLTGYKAARLNKAISEMSSIVNLKAPDIKPLAALEAEFAKDAFSQVGLTTALPTAKTLERIAATSLIEGATIGQWFGSLQETTRFELSRAVKLGVSLGETNGEILNRIKSANEKGTQVLAKTRRNGMAIVRTSVQTVSNEVRQATFQENADLVDGVQWLATLDGRTSDICIARSGLVWELPDYKPKGHSIGWNGGPPAHWNCRSTTIPVLKSLEQMGVDPKDIPPEMRSSMDGQVAADLTFDDFLRGKPASFADEMLGKGRAQLWRDNKITLSQLLDQRGNPLTLAQLSTQYGSTRTVERVRPKTIEATPSPTEIQKRLAELRAAEAAKETRQAGRLSSSSGEALAAALQRLDGYSLPQEIRDQSAKVAAITEQRRTALLNYNDAERDFRPIYNRLNKAAERSRKGQLSDRQRAAAISQIEELKRRQSKLDAAREVFKDLDNKLATASASLIKAGKRDLEQQLELISLPKAMRSNPRDMIRGKVTAMHKKKVEEATALISRIVHKDLTPNVAVATNRRSRASYNPKTATINMHSSSNVSSYVHEIVHDLEERYPEVLTQTRRFLEKRSGGAGPVPMSQLERGLPFDEIAYKDKWKEKGGNHYVGRIYSSEASTTPATELLTVGIERLLKNPKLFLEQDREYFEFIMKVFYGAF